MLLIAVIVAMVAGCLWMRSRQNESIPIPSPPAFTIQLDSEGVTLRQGASVTAWIRWADIRAVRSFKVDCFAWDLICVAAESRAEGGGFLVDEEHPQFDELVGAFEARLAGFDGEWFQKVAFPAFETCETVLYRSPSP